MMTLGVFLLGLCIGASVMLVLCRLDEQDAVRSACHDVERKAYARGYEDGSLPGQRKVLKEGVLARDKGTLLASEIEPAVLSRLARKWLEQGRRCQCHAWLALVPLLMMTDDEAWLVLPFWARLTIFIVVVFCVALWGAVLLIKDRDPGERTEEFFRNVNANMNRPDGGEGRKR